MKRIYAFKRCLASNPGPIFNFISQDVNCNVIVCTLSPIFEIRLLNVPKPPHFINKHKTFGKVKSFCQKQDRFLKPFKKLLLDKCSILNYTYFANCNNIGPVVNIVVLDPHKNGEKQLIYTNKFV